MIVKVSVSFNDLQLNSYSIFLNVADDKTELNLVPAIMETHLFSRYLSLIEAVYMVA